MEDSLPTDRAQLSDTLSEEEPVTAADRANFVMCLCAIRCLYGTSFSQGNLRVSEAVCFNVRVVAHICAAVGALG